MTAGALSWQLLRIVLWTHAKLTKRPKLIMDELFWKNLKLTKV
jgi:hypothetical protein